MRQSQVLWVKKNLTNIIWIKNIPTNLDKIIQSWVYYLLFSQNNVKLKCEYKLAYFLREKNLVIPNSNISLILFSFFLEFFSYLFSLFTTQNIIENVVKI